MLYAVTVSSMTSPVSLTWETEAEITIKAIADALAVLADLYGSTVDFTVVDKIEAVEIKVKEEL